MNFEALDGTRLTILMIAGAVFAAAGLYLLLKPKGAGTAKIELFGLKFESSSAGLLVFVIGAVFMAIPLFVPERTVSDGENVNTGATAGAGTSGQKDVSAPKGAKALVLPAGPDTSEVEPNDSLRQSNQISMGAIVSGVAERDSRDWFVIPIELPPAREVEFKLSRVSGDSSWMSIYDARERRVESNHNANGTGYLQMVAGNNDRFYIKIYSTLGGVYELSVSALGNQ